MKHLDPAGIAELWKMNLAQSQRDAASSYIFCFLELYV